MSTSLHFTQADYLRKAREVAGLSQRELAQRIGMSRDAVIAAEKRGTKKLYILKEWADATGQPVSELKPRPLDYSPLISHADRPINGRRRAPGTRSDSAAPRTRMDLSRPKKRI